MPTDNNLPATKEDIRELRQELSEVLRILHGWSRPTGIRLGGHEERLTLVETRLRHIEHSLIVNQ